MDIYVSFGFILNAFLRNRFWIKGRAYSWMYNWYNSFHINLQYKIQMNIIPNISQFFLFRQVPAEKGTDIMNVYLWSQEEQENLEYMNCISRLFCVWYPFIVQRATHVSLSLASPFWAHNSNLCVTTLNIQY